MRRMQKSWADAIGRRYFKPVGGAISMFFAGEALGMIFNSWPPIIVGLLFGLALLVWGWWPERKRNKTITVDANPATVHFSVSEPTVTVTRRPWWRRLLTRLVRWR